MSDPRDLARLAAQISDLTAEVADRDHRLAAGGAAAAALEAQLAAATAAAADAEKRLAAAQSDFGARLTERAAATAVIAAARDKALADRAALAEKFDKLMGDPVEPGIIVFQKYRTDDNAEHPTLAAARQYLAIVQLGMNPVDAPKLAARLKAHPDAVKTLIDTAT